MSNHKFIGKIESIDWESKNDLISLKGFCYVEGFNFSTNESVKKNLIISNGKKTYYLPLKNSSRTDIVDKKGKYSYKFSGFNGTIDIGYLDNMDSLAVGKWSIRLGLIINGYEGEHSLECDLDLKEYKGKILKNKRRNALIEIKPIIDNGDFCLKSVFLEELDSLKNKDLIGRMAYRGLQFVKLCLTVFGGALKICIIDPLIQILKYIKTFLIGTIYKTFKKFPLNEKKILFLSDSRSELDGNFSFIYDELVRRGGYDIHTMLKPTIESKMSIFEKFKFLYNVATSKYILLDDFYPKIYSFSLRKDVELVQLWHACGAFKTFGFSRLGKKGGPKIRSKNHRNYTKAIVSSEKLRKHYAEGFGISVDNVVSTGVPRTDIFFDEEYKRKKMDELYGKYPILRDKKVIMFAPTFRGNGQKTAYYDFDKFDIEKMFNEFGKEYVVIMKLHPFVKDVPKIDEKYSDFIIDLSAEREINDLLFISDILITDYSSVCFEYSLLNRPMIFFAYDMEAYIASRDFYYPYKSFVPGPIVRDTDGIVNVIKKGDFKLEKLESFRNKFFDHFDGKSTERVVDMILGSNDN
ncbi:CDP-glycerol glycerophosphotransferase family protein (plasmid) [Clostridium perfringens]